MRGRSALKKMEEASRSVHKIKKALEIAFGTAMLPELAIDAYKAIAGDDPHGDLISELLGLEIWVMCEHPYVSQLVSHHRVEFRRAQSIEEPILDGEPEGFTSMGRRLHRDNERDLRFDRDVDVFRNPQFSSQTIDHWLDTPDEEARRLSSWRGCDRAVQREEEERAGRQRDPQQRLHNTGSGRQFGLPCLAF